MTRLLGMVSILAMLAACDKRTETAEEEVEEPEVVEETDDGDDEEVLPDGAVASVGDISDADFEDGVVTIVVPLDGQDTIQEYALTGSVNGYDRFDQQETDINRAFVALAGSSSDAEELVAVVTMDGGQFNRFFGGAILEQNEFSAPDGGLTYYLGNYAGLVNIGQALDPAGDAPDAVIPAMPSEVTGTVYMVADFTDAATEGTIYDRELDISGNLTELPDLVLINTPIGSDGTFNGAIELLDQTGVGGGYEGAFGGEDAAYVGGVVAVDNTAYTGTDFEDAPNLQEYGIFIIGQCEPADCF